EGDGLLGLRFAVPPDERAEDGDRGGDHGDGWLGGAVDFEVDCVGCEFVSPGVTQHVYSVLTVCVCDFGKDEDLAKGDYPGAGFGLATLRLGQTLEPSGYTYMTPRLMATRAPIFSVLKMAAVQTILHGSRARTMSINPEYAA